MSVKTMFGFLNWNRDHVAKVAEMGFKPEDVIYCSNKPVSEEGAAWHPYTPIKASLNVAMAKNSIIKKAREKGADILFILEDDVLVKDMGVFDKYIDLMSKLDIGVVMYGYHSFMNKVMGKKNPAIIIDAEVDRMFLNRFCCGAVMGFDLRINDQLFDEEILSVELEEYMSRCSEKGIHKLYYGVFPDLWESWSHFDRLPFKTERIRTADMLALDKKTLHDKQIKLSVETNLDKIAKILCDNPKLK